YYMMDIPTVTIDNEEASRQIMEHLIGLGHRKILYISQGKGENDQTIEKFKIKGYMDSINSIREEPYIYEVNGHRLAYGYKIGEEVKEIIEKNGITAIFCCQDE